MIRKIIQIDEEKCNGCGACASACQEGAIGMVNGKAKLLRDDYCDGLGNCLPVCPTDAIKFIEREAAAYDEEAVKANMAKLEKEAVEKGQDIIGGNVNRGQVKPTENIDGGQEKMSQEVERGQAPMGGCPGMRARMLRRVEQDQAENSGNMAGNNAGEAIAQPVELTSQLMQWPVQIKLVPTKAPYFDGANLLIAADCTAYAYADFHRKFIRNHITVIGCPKLDEVDYTAKLTEIIMNNEIKSITIVRMEVPCCGGIERAAVNAMKASGKFLPWQVHVISTDGKILER